MGENVPEKNKFPDTFVLGDISYKKGENSLWYANGDTSLGFSAEQMNTLRYNADKQRGEVYQSPRKPSREEAIPAPQEKPITPLDIKAEDKPVAEDVVHRLHPDTESIHFDLTGVDPRDASMEFERPVDDPGEKYTLRAGSGDLENRGLKLPKGKKWSK